MSQTPSAPLAPTAGALTRFLDGDVWHSFKQSPTAMVAAVIALVCVVAAVFAPWLAPHNPQDLASLQLMDARLPPAWVADGQARYPLGTDDQGRDILSALMSRPWSSMARRVTRWAPTTRAATSCRP